MNSLSPQRLVPGLLIAFVAAQLALVAPVGADETSGRWFFEGGIGVPRDGNDRTPGTQMDKTYHFARSYLGYRIFGDYLAVQAGVVKFRDLAYTNKIAGTSDKFNYDGVHGKVHLNIPLVRDPDGFFGAFVSGGAWRWDAQIDGSNGSSRSHGESPTASAGFILSGRTSALKLEYERFMLKPKVEANAGGVFTDSGVVKLNYGVISLSFLVYF